MFDTFMVLIFLFALFFLLGSGVWVGLSLVGVAWISMELFTTRPAGDAMATIVWGSLFELDADRSTPLYLDGRDSLPLASLR